MGGREQRGQGSIGLCAGGRPSTHLAAAARSSAVLSSARSGTSFWTRAAVDRAGATRVHAVRAEQPPASTTLPLSPLPTLATAPLLSSPPSRSGPCASPIANGLLARKRPPARRRAYRGGVCQGAVAAGTALAVVTAGSALAMGRPMRRRSVAAATAAATAVAAAAMGLVAAAVEAVGARDAPSVAARQAACPALLEPANCDAIQGLLDDAAAEDALTRSVASWVVLVVLARTLVVLVDHMVSEARRRTVLLAGQAVGLFCRVGVVVFSSWYLSRLSGSATSPVEYRLLVVAVSLDAFTVLARFNRFVVECHLFRRVRAKLASNPPTYLICEESGELLNVSALRRGPRVLQSQLQFLVQDRESIFSLMQRAGAQFTRPTAPLRSLLWLAKTCKAFVNVLLFWLPSDVAIRFLSFPDLVPFDGRPLDAAVVGHQGATAATALDKHLSGCWSDPDTWYKRPLAGVPDPYSFDSLHVEAQFRAQLGIPRRLWTLARVPMYVYGGLRFWRRHSHSLFRDALSISWMRTVSRAPIDNLTIDPGFCEVEGSRVGRMQRALGPCSAGVPFWDTVLFGLRALLAKPGGRPDWAVLGHGYWWSRPSMDWWLHNENFQPETVDDAAPARSLSLEPRREHATHLSSELLSWRGSPRYARALLDDWEDATLPPAWSSLANGDGGLADFAIFGLQPWMVVADVDDNAGDLYLELGLAGSEHGRGEAGPNDESRRTTGNDAGIPVGGTTRAPFVDALKLLPVVTRPIRRFMETSSSEELGLRQCEEHDEWQPSFLPTPPAPLPFSPAVTPEELAERHKLPGLQLYPASLVAVLDTPLERRHGHAGLLRDWHERWHAVLSDACVLHGVCDSAREEVLCLPLVGFYPAMRVALDALRGTWEPLAGAVFSRTGRIVSGWPRAVEDWLRDTIHARLLPFQRMSPERVLTAGLAASFYLCRSAEEGTRMRQVLGIDIDSETLVPPGAGPYDAVATTASVFLTGWVITSAWGWPRQAPSADVVVTP